MCDSHTLSQGRANLTSVDEMILYINDGSPDLSVKIDFHRYSGDFYIKTLHNHAPIQLYPPFLHMDSTSTEVLRFAWIFFVRTSLFCS